MAGPIAELTAKQNYPLPISNGILEHREKIGASIWLFILLIDWTTEEENGVGKVLGGKPVKLRELMETLRLKERQVRSQLQRLRHGGYIRLRRTSYGYSIEVIKSKKFINRDRQKVAALPIPDRQKVAGLNLQTGNNVPDRPATFCRNKEDLTVDLTKKDRTKVKPSPDGLGSKAKKYLVGFREAYKNRFGFEYPGDWPRDMKIVKGWLTTLSLEALSEITMEFFNSDDEWDRKQGYSIPALKRRIEGLTFKTKSRRVQPSRKELPL